MTIVSNFLCYVRTLSFLKRRQLIYQLWYRIHTPTAREINVPALRKPQASWIAGIPRRVQISDHNRLRFFNREQAIEGAIDWDSPELPLLWRYHLHYFDFLNSPGDSQHHQWSITLLQRWLDEHPSGSGWQPYPISLRSVNWIRYELEGHLLPDGAHASLVRQIDLLSRSIEYHVDANHLFANGKALMFGGLYFDGDQADAWLELGLEILRNELDVQFFEDGGHYERSPMYHRILLEDVLDLYNLIATYEHLSTDKLLKRLVKLIPQAIRWMNDLSLPGGGFPLIGDAVAFMASPRDEILRYAGRLGFHPTARAGGSLFLTDSLYSRMEIAVDEIPFCLFATLGVPSPRRQPGHSHADCLSFELYRGDKALLVDGGVPHYAVSPERIASRKTRFHNALEIDGEDSSEVWSSFRVGRRARLIDQSFKRAGDGVILEGMHDGYRYLKDRLLHRRKWLVKPGGFEVIDSVTSQSRIRKWRSSHTVCIRFRAAPGLHWEPGEVAGNWRLMEKGKALLLLRNPEPAGWEYTVEKSHYYPEMYTKFPIEVLCARIDTREPVKVVHVAG